MNEGNDYSADRRGAAISSASLPSQQNDVLTSKQQERWEEMNRREKMDRYFENSTPKTVQQLQELNVEKSKEERRRLQWDLNWESQSKAIISADSTNADSTARSASMTSEEPTAPETPEIHKSRSGRGLAKFSEFLMNPWGKARKSSGVVGQKKGRNRTR